MHGYTAPAHSGVYREIARGRADVHSMFVWPLQVHHREVTVHKQRIDGSNEGGGDDVSLYVPLTYA